MVVGLFSTVDNSWHHFFLSIFTGIFSGNKIRSEMADVFDKDD